MTVSNRSYMNYRLQNSKTRVAVISLWIIKLIMHQSQKSDMLGAVLLLHRNSALITAVSLL